MAASLVSVPTWIDSRHCCAWPCQRILQPEHMAQPFGRGGRITGHGGLDVFEDWRRAGFAPETCVACLTKTMLAFSSELVVKRFFIMPDPHEGTPDHSEVATDQVSPMSASAYYDDEGLVDGRAAHAGRQADGSSTLRIRRLSFILIAQSNGLSLEEIRAHAPSCNRAQTQPDVIGQQISRGFRAHLDERIGMLERLRDRLDGCIGCGCLSLDACKLYNPGDKARATGTGPRLVLQKSLSRASPESR